MADVMTLNQHRALAAELAAMHRKLADLSDSLPASAAAAKKNADDAAKNDVDGDARLPRQDHRSHLLPTRKHGRQAMNESYTPQYRRVLPDGRVLDVWPLTFGRSRLHIGPEVDTLFYDDSW